MNWKWLTDWQLVQWWYRTWKDSGLVIIIFLGIVCWTFQLILAYSFSMLMLDSVGKLCNCWGNSFLFCLAYCHSLELHITTWFKMFMHLCAAEFRLDECHQSQGTLVYKFCAPNMLLCQVKLVRFFFSSFISLYYNKQISVRKSNILG